MKGFFYQPTGFAVALQERLLCAVRYLSRWFLSPASMRWVERAWANDSEYCVASSVRTRRAGWAMETARRLRYGCIWMTWHFMLCNEMPHGGIRRSDYGKDVSMFSLEDYTAGRRVMVKKG